MLAYPAHRRPRIPSLLGPSTEHSPLANGDSSSFLRRGRPAEGVLPGPWPGSRGPGPCYYRDLTSPLPRCSPNAGHVFAFPIFCLSADRMAASYGFLESYSVVTSMDSWKRRMGSGLWLWAAARCRHLHAPSSFMARERGKHGPHFGSNPVNPAITCRNGHSSQPSACSQAPRRSSRGTLTGIYPPIDPNSQRLGVPLVRPCQPGAARPLSSPRE